MPGDHAFLSEVRPTLVRRVGVKDVFGEPGQADELLGLYGRRAANVVEEALAVLRALS